MTQMQMPGMPPIALPGMQGMGANGAPGVDPSDGMNGVAQHAAGGLPAPGSSDAETGQDASGMPHWKCKCPCCPYSGVHYYYSAGPSAKTTHEAPMASASHTTSS
eukprot:SAG11_NODE_9692_length_889_cov_1.553165_2_plen_105_part_00